MRSLIFIAVFLVSMNSHCQSWFVFDKEAQTYDIQKNNVTPALFFEKVSLHTGIEIKFDKYIDEPLNLDFYKSNLNDLFDFLDKKYSTLKSYSKINNQEQLISIAILPKGIFQSDSMVIAANPIQEAIIHQGNESSEPAKNIYLTRMEKMNNKVKEQIQRAANKAVKMKTHFQNLKRKRQTEKDKADKAKLAELATLKQENPDVYKHRISIMSWRDPKIDNKVNSLSSSNTHD
jgi:uncharacterized protein YcbK (DUF882 family)